jgi:hypothetical protein
MRESSRRERPFDEAGKLDVVGQHVHRSSSLLMVCQAEFVIRFKSFDIALGIMIALALFSCTSIKVQPLPAELSPATVCIWENPRVQVEDFIDVLRDGFVRHGIPTEIHVLEPYEQCEFVVTYTALRSWDAALYLSHAEIYLERDRQIVASAEYHLRAKGGYSLYKFQSTKVKIDPVIDELLGGRQSRQAP